MRTARRLRSLPAAARISTALRDSELPAREVLELLPAAIYTIDKAGRIIDWSVENDELLLNWKEHGGPSLDGPAEREGFGGSLVRRLVTGQFGGELSFDWKPKGLIIRLSLPVERLMM